MTSHEIRNPLSAIVLSADSIITSFRDRITNPMTLSQDEADDTLNAAQTIILCANHQKKVSGRSRFSRSLLLTLLLL
jgi:nitrogen fixation/metabolism regulation signal transduction histidine kinase